MCPQDAEKLWTRQSTLWRVFDMSLPEVLFGDLCICGLPVCSQPTSSHQLRTTDTDYHSAPPLVSLAAADDTRHGQEAVPSPWCATPDTVESRGPVSSAPSVSVPPCMKSLSAMSVVSRQGG